MQTLINFVLAHPTIAMANCGIFLAVLTAVLLRRRNHFFFSKHSPDWADNSWYIQLLITIFVPIIAVVLVRNNISDSPLRHLVYTDIGGVTVGLLFTFARIWRFRRKQKIERLRHLTNRRHDADRKKVTVGRPHIPEQRVTLGAGQVIPPRFSGHHRRHYPSPFDGGVQR